ncbi:DUF1684 domain-containing protein [Aquirufa regiilacus]|uniref:DUF1684 domain-containing protein n=1 Tax=Aquirufa regiilacus TaxID=3024868 RepID=A0ABU3TS06_9BACT|nr:DUF1684 domain-containing protein [Aquirufa sp. LEOWEIH-7C]MDU0808661.1 DUF1684 domain-containing protein [Aquirufa sp. LEOWEIH-7C]
MRTKGVIFLLLLSFGMQAQNHVEEVKAFRAARINSLKSETGWLNLAGLFWLKEGKNTFGGDEKNDFVFPSDHSDPFLGELLLKDGKVYYQTVSDTMLVYQDGVKVPVISYRSLRWFIIKRGEKYAVRLRDLEGEYVKAFKGIDTFPTDSAYRVVADFIPTKGKMVTIIDVTGRAYALESPGLLRFKLGKSFYELETSQEGDSLFIVFGDLTNKQQTYGAGRFIDTALPDAQGKVLIDFNKAYNPPCAFTPFATCPLPTAANKLAVEIKAGEQFHGH